MQRVAVVLPTTTWQAYNSWGDHDLYDGPRAAEEWKTSSGAAAMNRVGVDIFGGRNFVFNAGVPVPALAPMAPGVPQFRVVGEFEMPLGAIAPAQLYAPMARRHMELYGTTSRQFAEIAVTTRQHAILNGNAAMTKPITIDDHQASRMISDPLRLFDCSLESDGGAAGGCGSGNIGAGKTSITERVAARLGRVVAHAAPAQMATVAARVGRVRAIMAEALTNAGIKVWPSEGNFLLCDFGTVDTANAADVFLRQRGIIVRNLITGELSPDRGSMYPEVIAEILPSSIVIDICMRG